MDTTMVAAHSEAPVLEASAPRQVWPRLWLLAIFAIAMGLLEAICVIYLRRLHPVSAWAVVPNIPPLERLRIEVVREACTLAMLGTVAWLGGINLRSRIACFFYVFGVWDIFYYIGLKWLADWPASWVEWDCLFLIPQPWYGPVLAPVLISALFAGACLLIHAWEIRGHTSWLSLRLIAGQLLAATLWYWSFVKDAAAIGAHGYAQVTYSWALLAAGMIISALSFWWASRSRAALALTTPG